MLHRPPHDPFLLPAARLAAALAVLVALGAGCGKDSKPPTAPAPPAPVQVVGVFPAPRSVFVDYTTDVWAEFDQPLDPATVNTRNVYLKLDTTRLPAAVTWDSTGRRIHVRPLSTLALLTTYTIELSANLASATGQRLERSYLWQFTTQSVRHPSSPFPADGAMDSPFVTVTWGGNESTLGPLYYELYAGPDSAAVAARATPYLYRGAGAAYMPRQRWREHGANYWAITVENPAYGERYHGRVWRFDTPPASAVVDSTDMVWIEWGYWRQGSFSGADCRGGTIVSGPSYKAYQTWAFSVPPPVRYAGVRWWISSTTATQDSLSDPVTVWASTAVPLCSFTIRTNVDEVTGALATGTRLGPRTILFDSDFLAAHMEALMRRGGLYGYFLRSGKTVTFLSPEGSEPDFRPRLRVYFYRVPAEPARLVAPSKTGSTPGARAPRFPLDRRARTPFNSR